LAGAGLVSGSNAKLDRAVVAAGEVFLRYGYVRTTMGDIAKEAGMSRAALYLLLPGKEQAFAAATMALATRRLEEIRAAVTSRQGLRDKLATGCVMLLVRVLELQQTTPDARDMDDLAFPVVREIYSMFEAFFAETIAEAAPALMVPAATAARVLLYGARGLREVADSPAAYTALIEAHVALICDGIYAAGASAVTRS
jgi:AcrR family transcriptional regulator